MKQTLITLLCLLAFTCTRAQIEQGSTAIGMNAGLGFYLNKDDFQSGNTFRVTAQPVFEYFVAKNLSLGAAVNCNFQFQTDDYKSGFTNYTYKSYVQTYGLGIQLKKYWFASPQIGFTATPQIVSSYYESNNSYEYANFLNNTTYNSHYWYHSAMLNVGAVYFVRPNLAIEAQTNFINYAYYPGSPSSSNNERHTFTVLAFQSSLTVGVKYILGNKKAGLTP